MRMLPSAQTAVPKTNDHVFPSESFLLLLSEDWLTVYDVELSEPRFRRACREDGHGLAGLGRNRPGSEEPVAPFPGSFRDSACVIT